VIFIDTGAIVARYRRSDDWHQSAIDGWAQLENSGRACYTINFVVAESLKLIDWCAGHSRALQCGREILSSSEIAVLRSGLSEELEALALMDKFSDQKLGFVDCVSMALMRRRRLTTIFGFDRHFQIAGFRLWPDERR
jgi:uncharacterized protein